MSIAIQIRKYQRAGSRLPLIGNVVLKSPVPAAQIHEEPSTQVVGGDDVEVVVSIEVQKVHDSLGEGANRTGEGKVSRVIAQKHVQSSIQDIAQYEVGFAVTIDIAHTCGAAKGRIVATAGRLKCCRDGRLKSAIAVSDKDRNRRLRVYASLQNDIELAVARDVCKGYSATNARGETDVLAVSKSSVPVSQQDVQRIAGGAIDVNKIGFSVVIDVRSGDTGDVRGRRNNRRVLKASASWRCGSGGADERQKKEKNTRFPSEPSHIRAGSLFGCV